MSRRSFLLSKLSTAFLAVVVAHVLVSAHAAEANSKRVKVWKITQNTQLGRTVWLISESAIKVSLPNQGISWLCASPSWKVLIFNSKGNLGLPHVLSFYGRLRSPSIESGKIDTNSIVRTRTKFEGRPATKLTAKVISSDPIHEKLEMMYQESKSRSDNFKNVEFVYEDWIPKLPQQLAFLCGYYKNTVGGVRLEQIHQYTNRTQKVITTEAIGQTTVPSSEFAYPTGFREVRKMHEIMMEKDQAKQMSGVIEDLFMDSRSGPPPKRSKPKGAN
jgi:hypothetical protein